MLPFVRLLLRALPAAQTGTFFVLSQRGISCRRNYDRELNLSSAVSRASVSAEVFSVAAAMRRKAPVMLMLEKRTSSTSPTRRISMPSGYWFAIHPTSSLQHGARLCELSEARGSLTARVLLVRLTRSSATLSERRAREQRRFPPQREPPTTLQKSDQKIQRGPSQSHDEPKTIECPRWQEPTLRASHTSRVGSERGLSAP